MGPPGHLAIGLAARPAARKAPLWVLLAATELLDLLCFAFQAAGIESAGVSTTDLSRGVEIMSLGTLPWSHGLFMCVVWSVVAAALAFFFYRDRRTSIVIGSLVFSHWVLDFIVHVPDLPLLFEGSPVVGLGLWGSGPGLVISGILEVGLLVGGIAIYRVTRKRSTVQARE
jgi:membrane-bound metal-dependent hydrolase YbcI (DUF457 family)